MNGKTLSFAITSPLTRPTAHPVSSAARTPAAIPWLRIAKALKMLTSATVAPTERSRPAVMIANVCPNDTPASAAAATPMLRKLGTEKNTSEISENSKIIKATTSGRTISRP